MFRWPKACVICCLCTVFGTCSKPFPEADAGLLLLLEAANHYIFVTSSIYTGDLKTAGGGSTGIEGADRLCAQAKATEYPALPGAGDEYRALLVDSANRIACTSPNCSGGNSEHVNWVLQPTTTYRRPDGGVVFTTDASAIFDLTGGLQNALASGGQWWTGLDSDWNEVGASCTDWEATIGNGLYGSGGTTTSLALTDGAFGQPCSTQLALLCVR